MSRVIEYCLGFSALKVVLSVPFKYLNACRDRAAIVGSCSTCNRNGGGGGWIVGTENRRRNNESGVFFSKTEIFSEKISKISKSSKVTIRVSALSGVLPAKGAAYF